MKRCWIGCRRRLPVSTLTSGVRLSSKGKNWWRTSSAIDKLKKETTLRWWMTPLENHFYWLILTFLILTIAFTLKNRVTEEFLTIMELACSQGGQWTRRLQGCLWVLPEATVRKIFLIQKWHHWMPNVSSLKLHHMDLPIEVTQLIMATLQLPIPRETGF